MPKRALSVAALAIAATIGITGCSINYSAPTAPSAPSSQPVAASPAPTSADSPTTAPSPADQNSTKPATDRGTTAPEKGQVKPADAHPAQKAKRSSGSAVTLAYQDSYKTVYTMTADQVSAFSGIAVTSANLDRIVTSMGESAHWKAQKPTAKYAGLIATAVDRETNSTRNAVRAVIRDSSARVQVYVSHNRYATIAHIGITHNN